MLTEEMIKKDPRLNGTKACANCKVKGKIGWAIDTGYFCNNCGSNDSDE